MVWYAWHGVGLISDGYGLDGKADHKSEDYGEVATLYTACIENKSRYSPSTYGSYIRDVETEVRLVSLN